MDSLPMPSSSTTRERHFPQTDPVPPFEALATALLPPSAPSPKSKPNPHCNLHFYQVVKWLLANGANYHKKTRLGWTALKMAQKMKHERCVHVIQEHMNEAQRAVFDMKYCSKDRLPLQTVKHT